MPPAARRPIELEPGTLLAAAVSRGSTAFARGDAADGDAAYRQAVRMVGSPDSRLWSALVIDHVTGLLRLRQASAALQRCDEYLNEAGADHNSVRLLRAELRSSLADHPGVDSDVAQIRTALRLRPDSLTVDEHARLSRVAGLSAAEQGDLDRAAHDLAEARRLFLEVDHQAGVQAVDRDRLMLAVRQGEEGAVDDMVSDGPLETVSDRLLHAVGLKRQLRYEEARNVVQSVVDGDLDPALRFPVLCELSVLLRLLRHDDAAERLLSLLHDAVMSVPDPVAGAAALARLSEGNANGGAVPPAFDRRLQHSRRLILSGRLDDAERVLIELRPRTRTTRDICTWYLGAGELEVARSTAEPGPFGDDAVRYLSKAAEHASTTALVEVRVDALRQLGRVYARLDQDDRAVKCWAEAHRLEEHIAGRQITDDNRIRILQAASDEYDERIRAAAEALNEHDAEGAAAIVVAMEAARGAAILGRILPDQAGFARDLPRPSDLDGAWRWVAKMGAGLPPSQVVWLMHSTPDRVHHAVIGRGFLHHASVPSVRKRLTAAIDALMRCWSDENILEKSIADGTFAACLQEVTAEIGLDAVFPDLSPKVSRIAIVAGEALADIPFAAMKIPGNATPIGLRFALSDLPCLAARLPLYRRSLQLRGDRGLLVRPPSDNLTRATQRDRLMLDSGGSTPAELRAALELHRHRRVRIDSHGRYDPADPTRKSWLELAPGEPDGRLTPEQLQRMDLRGCGTLVLGACESGMAERIGRDERTGFVRAAIHAGAASVVAARWVAEDTVAAAVLDGFDRYVRYLPRDVALQRAQHDVYAGAPGIQVDVPVIDHPAHWACWTLYGDSGWQTGAGPVRRSLRRIVDEWT